jgi:hypothetical protein
MVFRTVIIHLFNLTNIYQNEQNHIAITGAFQHLYNGTS